MCYDTATLDPTGFPEEEEEASKNRPIGDLPGAVITDADQKLMDDGSHLDGNIIQDDAVWQG
jgi:hypothetical protein